MTQTAKRVGTYLITALDLNVIGHGDTPTALGVVASVIAAEIDALTRERDEAQRIIGIYNTSRDEVIAQLCETNDALRAERDEARAEVERLRPAAEAWEALEAYRALDGKGRATYEMAELGRERMEAMHEAAARARAAKESR